MYFYRPDGFVYTRLDSFEQLRNVMNIGAGPVSPDHRSDFAFGGTSGDRAASDVGIRTYPAWLERYNYLHWLDRSRTFSMYAIEGDSDSDVLTPTPQGVGSAAGWQWPAVGQCGGRRHWQTSLATGTRHIKYVGYGFRRTANSPPE